MKAKTKFKKMYYKLPKDAREVLVYGCATNPMTLTVCMAEVNHNTEMSKEILSNMGFKDD